MTTAPDRSLLATLLAPAVGVWRRVFGKAFVRAETLSHEWMAANAGRADSRSMVVLATAALSLTLLNYYDTPAALPGIATAFAAVGLVEVANAVTALHVAALNDSLTRLAWWVAVAFAGYVVVPVLVIRLVLRERVRDFGLSLRGALTDWWLYPLFLCAMVPLVVAASADAHFLATYPFWRPSPGESLWPKLLAWEALYFAQFAALEFFFRGFVLHGTAHRFGFNAVFVMMVPYCLIHFGKPMPETLGAIGAGIVLGALSLKTRSIWLGAAIHCAVAITMDLCALIRTGQLQAG